MAGDIILTKLGSPVCAGEITLKQEDVPLSLPSHDKVMLTIDRDTSKTDLKISDYHDSRDHKSGFYNATIKNKSSTQIILPPAMANFVLSYLKNRNPYKKEICDFISEDNNNFIMGYANYRPQIKSEKENYVFRITRSSLSLIPHKGGVKFHLLADAHIQNQRSQNQKPQNHQNKIIIEAKFFMNEETARFRFNGTIREEKLRPSLRRAYAGNEVNSDIDHLNLKHPIIHNTGGTFALSNSGLYGFHFAENYTKIFPTTLEGSSWGSVYKTANPIPNKNILTLNMLTKHLLETLMQTSAYFENDKLKTSLYLQKGDIGFYAQDINPDRLEKEDTPYNLQKIETLMIELTIDRFGFDIGLDAQLSSIEKNSYRADLNPNESEIFKKNLLLPWEVLICRDFNMKNYIHYWYTDRHTQKPKKNSRLATMLYKKPRKIPFKI